MTELATGISVDEAVAAILSLGAAYRMPVERVPLHEAHGRYLAVDVSALIDLPPFANSAMDGFAVCAADVAATGYTRLRIAGTRFAGDTAPARIVSGECLRITTGAPLPDGADAVVIKERVSVADDTLVVPAGVIAGANVRRAGEDYARGERALSAGERLGAGRLGVLASLGLAEVEVAVRPRVAVLATGDELVAAGAPLGHGQIHNSNGYSLAALALAGGAVNIDTTPPFRHVRDDADGLREALLVACARADVVITSGGVSAGERDLLPDLLAELGHVHFWKVRMRPGMPVLCGSIDGCVLLGLPGNPVSGIATFLAFVQPLLRAMQGANDAVPPRLHARLGAAIGKRHDRTEFLRARLESRADGSLWVHALARQGSGMLRGIVDADALLVMPESAHELAAESVVEVIPLPTGY